MLRSLLRLVAILLFLVGPTPAFAYVAVSIDGGPPVVVSETYDSTTGVYFVENYDVESGL